MATLKRLIHEVHRRSLWQVLGIYLGVCWLVLQVVDVLTDNFGLPDWVPPFALVLLLLGLPVVLATAFVQEGVRGGRGPAVSPAEGISAAGAGPPGRPFGTAAADPLDAGEAPAGEAPGPSAAPPGREGTHHRLFTWRNAILGGVAAFALLGVLATGYMASRALGIGPAATLVARGVLEERDRILIAEFANRTDDSDLASVVAGALRVDLSQSTALRLVEPAFVTEALERMSRPADAVLDEALARELAQREGIKAVLVGEVGEAGGGYLLAARLIAPATGETLVSERETTREPGRILDAIDKLSKRLRERVGESLRTIRADPPLEAVTTPNLDALRLYTQAVRAIETEGDAQRGIALLEEAVALDTAFAAAYRKLGVTLGNEEERFTRQVEALTKAFEHRDRLTRRERYMAMGSYYQSVLDDTQAGIDAYETLLRTYPDDVGALNNVAILYGRLHDYDRAEALYLEAAALDSMQAFPLQNVVWLQAWRGGLVEADSTLAMLRTRFPDNPRPVEYQGHLAVIRGDYEAAERSFEELREGWGGSLYWRGLASRGLSALAAVRGRLREADALTREAMDIQEQRGLPAQYLESGMQLAWRHLEVRRDTARALRHVEDLLARHPLEELAPLDRPYFHLADFYAIAGRPDRARELIVEWEMSVPAELRVGARNPLAASRIEIAIASGRYEEAIESLRSLDARRGCRICGVPSLALAYDLAGQADSAIAAYERYLGMGALYRLWWDEGLLAETHERLGLLYDERGELENAARHYARFVELWAEADPELQPRVRAAQERLEAIVTERG